MNLDDEFIKHAYEAFQFLHWKPAKPEDCDGPHIIAYGNVDNTGCGVVCVIDTLANLFKLELKYRDNDAIAEAKCVYHYTDSKSACVRFDKYLDALGGFYKDGWLANAHL